MRRPPPVEPTRLRDLPAEDDLVGVAELIDAAATLPEVTSVSRQRMRGRLGRALRSSGRRRGRWRLRLSPVLVVVAALVSAGVGGAAVQSIITERRLQREAQARDAEPAPGAVRPRGPRRARKAVASLDVTDTPPPTSSEAPEPPSAEAPPMETPPAPASASSPPLALGSPSALAPAGNDPAPPVPRRPSPLPARTEVPRPDPRPAPAAGLEPPPFAQPALTAPPAPSPEAVVLAEAIRVLRRDGDPDAALALIERHRMRFPNGTLAPEAAAVRIEALLKAGRTDGALAELDRLPLDRIPGHEEWRVARGELRANAARWRDAETDFSVALERLSGGDRADLAERALWGRGVARARRGDASGARADYALYLERFPGGRFARQARLALPGAAPAEPRAP